LGDKGGFEERGQIVFEGIGGVGRLRLHFERGKSLVQGFRGCKKFLMDLNGPLISGTVEKN